MDIDDETIKGFKTMWIQFNTLNVDKHQLFFKEHSVRNQNPQYPKGRTLFVLNVPPYVTTDVLRSEFGEFCGNVQSVTFANSKGFKTAYIVFEKESSLDKALSLSKGTIMVCDTKAHPCRTGLAKWTKEYNDSLCNEKKLKEEIEEYMKTYDERIAERIANEKAPEGAEDGDEWITVTGRKKRGQFAPSRKESTINKVLHKEEERKRKKQLLNFYTFQIRESKKQNLAELRKKFELDKKRLQELKLKRTFKPF